MQSPFMTKKKLDSTKLVCQGYDGAAFFGVNTGVQKRMTVHAAHALYVHCTFNSYSSLTLSCWVSCHHYKNVWHNDYPVEAILLLHLKKLNSEKSSVSTKDGRAQGSDTSCGSHTSAVYGLFWKSFLPFSPFFINCMKNIEMQKHMACH